MEHPEGLRTPNASEHAAAPVHAGGSGLPARLEVDPAQLEVDAKEQRWRLVRDLAVFQAKLVVDGLKDLVLSPVSLVAALLGLLLDRRDPGRSFYMVLRWGHGFDRWVNLFGSSPQALPPASEAPADELPPITGASAGDGLDAYVTKLERVLVEQYRRGGLTAKAKDALDQAIDGLQARGRRPPE